MPHAGAARPQTSPRAASSLPEPPEASFWLERTPLPTFHRPPASPARAAGKPHGRSAMAPPGTVCPKCDGPLSPSEPACPACGLKRAMFNRFRAGTRSIPPATLQEQWAEVEAGWSDPERHERFLAQVSLCGAYAYAASRYRKAARARGSDAISKLQLERLSRMVHAVMAVSSVRQADERARPYRRLLVFGAVVIAVASLVGMWMFYRGRAGDEQAGEQLEPSIKVGRGRSIGPGGRGAPAFGGLRAKVPPPAEQADGEEPAADEGGEAVDQSGEPRGRAAGTAAGEADEAVQE